MKLISPVLSLAFVGILSLAATVVGSSLFAEEAQVIPMEKKVIADGNTRWRPIDSTSESVTTPTKSDSSVLHWHVSVDYHAADGTTSIKWPRVVTTLRGADGDWSGWNFLHFWIRADTPRPELPENPVEFRIQQTASKTNAFKLVLSDLKKGEWFEVSIPISILSHPHEIHGLQFTMFEKNYRDGDQVDFYIDEITLEKYSHPVLLSLAAENPLSYDDAHSLVAEFILSGVTTDKKKKVTFALLREGKAVVSEDFTAVGGKNRVVLPLGASGTQVGNYQLSAKIEGESAVSIPIRFVASPWR